MFTGIITHIGRVADIVDGGDRRFHIASDLPLDTVDIGASIAHSGVCLTVVSKDSGSHVVAASAETLARSTLCDWRIGDEINLELSLRLGDELGGHLVFGHADGVLTVRDIRPEGDSHRLTLDLPEDLRALVAPKGSVALDGISLTVNEVGERTFGVNIIPHTWSCTTMRNLKPGASMNFEVDMLARYVARRMQVGG